MLNLSVLTEPAFCPHSLNKYASIMACGNGYMGLRATHEEDYTQQNRGMYLAGLYHCAGRNETNERVNLPDILGIELLLNGEYFTLLSGEILSWKRELHFASGELRRTVIWRSPEGKRFAIDSRRFVSQDRLPLIAMQFSITPLDGRAEIALTTGIDATQTNSGRQHLNEISVRVVEPHLIQGVYETQDTVSDVVISAFIKLNAKSHCTYTAKNRRLHAHHVLTVEQGTTVTLDKMVWVIHRDDKSLSLDTFSRQGMDALIACAQQGYEALLNCTTQVWTSRWNVARVQVDSSRHQDQVALDYAVWHLNTMTPLHDERCSIGAKGLTGEGYKGHVFWDTEIFILPFHLFTCPETAKKLLRYRWRNLAGARDKARRNGWPGALFPWESAVSGKEETPEFAAINIRTGIRQKVASAQAEHHIVADIAWAVVAYWHATHDEAFMRNEGLALLKETALFWMGRVKSVNNRLEIHDVIGPDEYTEHVNNNAYTNYLAWHNVDNALKFMLHFACDDPLFVSRAQQFLTTLWLPEADHDGVMPQDDTFMSKPAIDLSVYKAHPGKQTILQDYSRAEINDMQILKQADVVMLNYLQPERFDQKQCAANLAFYEPRTIHDSSLSKAIHGVVAAWCGDRNSAYTFWCEGAAVDLGEDPHSCDDGIHAAATGAIWSGAVQGFAGVQILHGELHIAPVLPEQWQRLSFPFQWRNARIRLTVGQETIAIETSSPVELTLFGNIITVSGYERWRYGNNSVMKIGTATMEGNDEA